MLGWMPYETGVITAAVHLPESSHSMAPKPRASAVAIPSALRETAEQHEICPGQIEGGWES